MIPPPHLLRGYEWVREYLRGPSKPPEPPAKQYRETRPWKKGR